MGIITGIEVQKKNKNRVNVYVDGEFTVGLTIDSVLLSRLKTGREISSEELKEAAVEDEKRAALSALFKLLGRKNLTEKMAREALVKYGYIPEAVDFAAENAKASGYIDDRRYAEAFIESRSEKYGSLKIRYELKLKGVDGGIIDDLLSESDDSDTAFAIAVKYLRGQSITDFKQKSKTLRYLASKGCSFEAAKRALKRYAEELSLEDDR